MAPSPRRKRSLGQWLGITEERWPKEEGQEIRQPKTAWDFLQLLIVPAVLVGLSYAFNASQAARDHQREDKRAQQAARLAASSRMDDLLEAYLTRMGDLILDERLGSARASADVGGVARTLTLTVLRRLDGARKGEVVRFLADSHLVNQPPTIRLHYANLRGARLDGAILDDVVFDAADLTGARFDGAGLDVARFQSTRLTYASFKGARLAGANFALANLRHASFANARFMPEVGFDSKPLRSVFAGACLNDVSFAHADAQEASFAQAEGSRVNFDAARLRSADRGRAKQLGMTDKRDLCRSATATMERP